MPDSSLSPVKKIGINAVTSGCQVLVVGLVYFFLYRFLLRQLGPAMLGVWSLVLATASLATMANLGITTGLVKFVAEFNAKGAKEDLHTLLYTAFITIIVFFGVLVIILYFVVLLVLPKIVAPEYLGIAKKMLPFSLFSLFANEVGGVFTSVLDGLQKNYRKNIIYIVSSVLMLAAGYVLVPKFGIQGMAYAQAGQSVFVAVTAFVICSRLISLNSFFKSRWNRSVFKKIFSYGVKFQFISVCQMLYEPTTKALISKFGGLSLLGFYEMASRLVSQVRALIVNANQVIVPVVAAAMHNNKNAIKTIYENSVSIILLVSIPLTASIVVFCPAVSLLWVGRYEPQFIISVYLLCGGTFFNILCGPAYFGYMGEGDLGKLLKIHLLMAVANILLGALAGEFLKGYGIIGLWSIVLAGGSLFVMRYYQKSKGITFGELFSLRTYLLLLCGVLPVIFVKLLFNYANAINIYWQTAIEAAVICAAVAPFIVTQKHIKLFMAGRLKKE